MLGLDGASLYFHGASRLSVWFLFFFLYPHKETFIRHQPWTKEKDFPGGSDSKASAYSAGDPGSIPGSGRSSGEGNGNPLQYSCLENPMDGGAW